MTFDPFSGPNRPIHRARSGFSRRAFCRGSALLLALQSARVRQLAWLGPAVSKANAAPVDRACFSAVRTPYPPQLQGIIATLDPAADDFVTERYAAQLEQILQSWSATLCRSVGELAPVANALNDPLTACSWRPSGTTQLRATGSLHIERRHFSEPAISSREKLLDDLASYLAPFASLEVVELEIYGLRVTGESPLGVDCDVRCDLVGTVKGGNREQRVGAWLLSWTHDPATGWKVTRWVVHPEVRSQLIGPGFTDITADCVGPDSPGMKQLQHGIDDWRTALDGACGIDVYGNHGIATGDIDGSGFDSFYVCQPSGLPNRLYKNCGDGTFEDITEISGVGILDGTASALFADFLNRGMQDLLVVRTAGPLLFVNHGGRFEPHPEAFRFAKPPQGTFTSAAIADYNRDGLLDVYFCVYSYYQGLNQYQFPSPYYDAQNGPPNFLFRNRGDGTFEDVTAASGLNQNNDRFSFAAEWCDYDNSGWPSIYVANDFGRKNLYHNNGDGTFRDIAAEAGVEDYGPGMSTCWLDYDNDGKQDLYVANMWLKEGQRITANDHFLPDAPAAVRALYRKHNAGNSLYRNVGNGSFQDRSLQAGSEMGRWSWSCASWDFDHDGFADIYVANGFVSGPNRDDLQSFFWRQVARRSFTPDGPSPGYEMAWNAVNELVRADYSWSGYQRNVFFANNHDGTFSDVSGVLGLDLRDDSRAFALSDFDHDGRMEFVLKNRTGPQLRVFRNDLRDLGNAITLRLSGRKSNRDAIGAMVTVDAQGKRQTKFVSAGSGFASQHSKELCFGVGSAADPVSVSVAWPSGGIDVYEHVPLNHRVEIEEGRKTLKVWPYRERPARIAGRTQVLLPLAAPATVKTWLIAPLFGADLKLKDLQEQTHDIHGMHGPCLLSFFRVDCGESREQIEQLQQAYPVLSKAGIVAMAVAVDGEASRTAVQDFAGSARLEIPVLLADERTLGAWNIQFRYLFDRRRDMSFPISFLLDGRGAILRIYQGRMDPLEAARDWASAPASPAQRLSLAMPFPGPYYGNPVSHNYFSFGIAFVEYGYLDEGQAALQRAVEQNPEYAAAWFNLGTVQLNQKQYREARQALQEAVRLDPHDAEAWNNLGLISADEEKYEEALAEFQTSARANPNYLVPIQNMMRIYRFQKRPAEAQKALEELLALSPNNADLHLGLAMALEGQNLYEQALEELETAVRLRPNHSDALNNLGVMLSRLGKTQEALMKFEKCQRLAPDFDRPFINAAMLYSAAGQPAKARQILDEFLRRHPDDTDVHDALGKVTK